MSFKYVAVDEQGKKVTGVITDKTKKEALKELSLKNLTVTSIEKLDDLSSKKIGPLIFENLKKNTSEIPHSSISFGKSSGSNVSK